MGPKITEEQAIILEESKEKLDEQKKLNERLMALFIKWNHMLAYLGTVLTGDGVNPNYPQIIDDLKANVKIVQLEFSDVGEIQLSFDPDAKGGDSNHYELFSEAADP